MLSTRHLFSTFTECLSNHKKIRFSACVALAGFSQFLSTACDQAIEGDDFEHYYAKAPSRIVWLMLSSLFYGWNFDAVIEAILQYMQNNENDHISAKKVWGLSTITCGAQYFIQKALSTPINEGNAPYMAGNTLINALFFGALTANGGYLLQKFNYNILPFGFEHGKLITAGTTLSMLQEVLHFMCQEMIDHNAIEWDSLISPPRLLVLNSYMTLLRGILYGISFYNLKKYSEVASEEKPLLKIRNILLGSITLLTPFSMFTYLALTEPLNLNNWGYIVGDSFVTGFPDGFLTASTLYTIIKLKFDHDYHPGREIVVNPSNENREFLLSQHSFLADKRNDPEESTLPQREYVPPDEVQIQVSRPRSPSQ